ncbi:methanol dehydrogenase, partial [Salmonella enterica subsp. enterica]|nr:methanol dehydrogenase [Salmonella enterica subsp. enterica]
MSRNVLRLVAALLLVLTAAAALAQTYPALTGRVVDN